MKGDGSALRKFSLFMLALIAGLCLFAAIASARLDNSLFDSELHNKILNNSDIYSETGSILKSSLDDYLKAPDSGSPESLQQQEQLVSFIDKAITPEMIKMNIDSIIQGLLQYFKNESRFLPDIYINPVQDKPLDELQTNTDKDDKVSSESLTKIDKINLSVILMYMNRSDITDRLSVVKLFQFALAKTPFLTSLLFAVTLLTGLLLMKNKRELMGWINTTALFAGYTFTLSGVSLLIYLYYILPANHSFISLSVPLQADTAVVYIQNWLYSSALFFIISAIILVLFVPVFRLFTRLTSGWEKIAWLRKDISFNKSRINICGRRFGIKPTFAAIGLLSIVLISFLYFGALKHEFLSNDLTVAVERMKGITAFSRVVFAQDAAVNTLELRMVERKTNTPVQGIHTKISGKSAKSGSTFNEGAISDTDGISKTTLDIGSYKLNFDSTQFPDEYKLPPPYLFEMKAAGSTVITISLDKIEESKPGILEMKILDKDNQPVKGLKLALLSTETESESISGGSAFSFTNSEGVAAFITEAGNFRVSFLTDGFPAEYFLPEPMEIYLDPDVTARYSIKLAEKNYTIR